MCMYITRKLSGAEIWKLSNVLYIQNTIKLGYDIMKGTEYFASL
jgi:hypothetical protein